MTQDCECLIMPRPRHEHPTPGELEVLKVLWDSGPSTGPLIDPSPQQIDFFAGQLTARIGGRHPLVGIVGGDAPAPVEQTPHPVAIDDETGVPTEESEYGLRGCARMAGQTEYVMREVEGVDRP